MIFQFVSVTRQEHAKVTYRFRLICSLRPLADARPPAPARNAPPWPSVQNPSSTILPRARPLSMSACARLRFLASIRPKCSVSVVRMRP